MIYVCNSQYLRLGDTTKYEMRESESILKEVRFSTLSTQLAAPYTYKRILLCIMLSYFSDGCWTRETVTKSVRNATSSTLSYVRSTTSDAVPPPPTYTLLWKIVVQKTSGRKREER